MAEQGLDFSTFSNIINGKLAKTAATRCGINPATNEELEPVPVSTVQDVENAVIAARKAFPEWSQIHIGVRKSRLGQLAEALLSLKSEFAALLTAEQGKPVRKCS